MEAHQSIVRQLSHQVQAFYDAGQPFRVYNRVISHSMRPTAHPPAMINTGDLHNILEVDIENSLIMVEPNVQMDHLLKETLKHGLMPQVAVAFPGTTVGGLFSCTAASSASFKYGFFDRSVTWLEAVLADGEITRASRWQNSELLSGLVGTLGTIAITTLFQIKLVPTSTYVDLTYLPVESRTEALDTLNRCSQDLDNDFVEGLIYGEKASTYGVIAVGKLSAIKIHRERRFSRARDEFFYQHVLKVGSTVESVPIEDYIFRYDRASFCMGQYCFGRVSLNKWTRWLTNPAMHSRNLAQTIHALRWDEHFIMQDVVIPLDASYVTLQFLEEHLKIYPLRLCPIRQWPEVEAIMRPNPHKTSLFMGMGIRGYTEDTITNPEKFKETNRELEQMVHRVGGTKWLFARTYYSEDEFWDIYPRLDYEMLRLKYNAQYLESVYDKIKLNERRPTKAQPKGFWNWVFARTCVLAMKHKVGEETTKEC
jgi:delta24-sterol reductase